MSVRLVLIKDYLLIYEAALYLTGHCFFNMFNCSLILPVQCHSCRKYMLFVQMLLLEWFVATIAVVSIVFSQVSCNSWRVNPTVRPESRTNSVYRSKSNPSNFS